MKICVRRCKQTRNTAEKNGREASTKQTGASGREAPAGGPPTRGRLPGHSTHPRGPQQRQNSPMETGRRTQQTLLPSSRAKAVPAGRGHATGVSMPPSLGRGVRGTEAERRGRHAAAAGGDPAGAAPVGSRRRSPRTETRAALGPCSPPSGSVSKTLRTLTPKNACAPVVTAASPAARTGAAPPSLSGAPLLSPGTPRRPCGRLSDAESGARPGPRRCRC